MRRPRTSSSVPGTNAPRTTSRAGTDNGGLRNMPKVFDQELGSVKQDVLRMGSTVEQMIRDSMRALVDRDENLISEGQQKEEETDRLQVGIDDQVVRLIVTYAPVAQDLRSLLMVARINTELERVGDQAVEICHNVKLLLGVPPLKPLGSLPNMAELAERMVHGAIQAFSEKSPDR